MGLEIQDHGHHNSITGVPKDTDTTIPVVIKGHHNTISMEPGLKAEKNCEWIIQGNHNRLSLGPQVFLKRGTRLKMEGNHNQVTLGANFSGNIMLGIQTSGATFHMGAHATVAGGTFAIHEPYRLVVGKDCMFAAGVFMTVSDMHSIYDVDSKERVNPGGNILIGDHVWLGFRSIVLKGVHIGQGSVIGAGAIVTKDIPEQCLAVENPAKVIRERINWTRHMDGKTPRELRGLV